MELKSNINGKKPFSIGIIGGGQLALMLVEAANERGKRVCVQTYSEKDPGGIKADSVINADPLQLKGNKALIDVSEKIIFENEWVHIDSLKLTGFDESFIPALLSIEPLVDRISQKRFLHKLNLPSPKWISLKDFKELSPEEQVDWKPPLMAKTFKGGYDGKGNQKIMNTEELVSFISSIDSEEWLIEEWVEYDNEFALVGSRDFDGKIRLFPLVETFQSNNICDWVISPANINYEINQFAFNIFSSIVNELSYVGVLGIEFFYGKGGLQINEIAPRTHNSGHFSIEACTSSQFDQQICISSGIQAPEIKMKSPGALMVNLLGLNKNKLSVDERIKKLTAIKGAHLHWYGKSEEIKGRKMGHITFLLNDKNHQDRLAKCKKIINKIRKVWPSPHD